MPAGRWQAIAVDDLGPDVADLGVYAGPLYRTQGPAFNAVPFAPFGPANLTQVGADAGDVRRALRDARLHGGRRSRSRRPSASRCSAPARQTAAPRTDSRASSANVQDLWWNPAESGWGLNIAHQDDTLFATLFTYGADGGGIWLVMSNGLRRPTARMPAISTAPPAPRSTRSRFTPVATCGRAPRGLHAAGASRTASPGRLNTPSTGSA